MSNDTHDKQDTLAEFVNIREGLGLFPLGDTVITRGAMSSLLPDELLAAITRHASGDWGDCDEFDWLANNEALQDGGRILSVYRTRTGKKFWIITEADRSVTTTLLPEEY